ncbi:MAG: PEP-CTERM sorting domain-containing protein, partial [Gammaproteobacteria bacterium]|nr:PEP-CTERM sorting domain-containing protein [Gammaproteobacteria bacterium]
DVDTTYMCIDLWIPSEAYLAANVGTRFAGFWGTAIDAFNVISAYPIVEYRQDANGDFGFSVWNGAGWDDLGAPTGFANEAWYSLEMVMVGDDVTFNVGDISHTVSYGLGTQSFTNAILQGYNTTDGVTYDIYWDNFKTEPIPEPGTMVLLGMGIAGMAMRRFRKRA